MSKMSTSTKRRRGIIIDDIMRFTVISASFLIICMIVLSFVYKWSLSSIALDICAAVIGVILTAIITCFLLFQQTKSEEVKERNSKVFEKKLDMYEEFLGILENVFMDDMISDVSNSSAGSGKADGESVDEVKVLLFQLARLNIHTSDTSVSEVYQHITTMANHVSALNQDSDISVSERNTYYNNLAQELFGIVRIFKKELGASRTEEDDGAAALQDFWKTAASIAKASEASSRRKSFLSGIDDIIRILNDEQHALPEVVKALTALDRVIRESVSGLDVQIKYSKSGISVTQSGKRSCFAWVSFGKKSIAIALAKKQDAVIPEGARKGKGDNDYSLVFGSEKDVADVSKLPSLLLDSFESVYSS